MALVTLAVSSPTDTLNRLVSLSDSADESPFPCVETSSSPPLALSDDSGSADAVALSCCRDFPISQLLAVEPSVRAFLIGFDAIATVCTLL